MMRSGCFSKGAGIELQIYSRKVNNTRMAPFYIDKMINYRVSAFTGQTDTACVVCILCFPRVRMFNDLFCMDKNRPPKLPELYFHLCVAAPVHHDLQQMGTGIMFAGGKICKPVFF